MSERVISCPRCREQVAVPLSGEKIRCPGCGQKLRFDTEAPASDDRPPDGPLPLEPDEPPDERTEEAEEREPVEEPPDEPPPLPTPKLTAPPELPKPDADEEPAPTGAEPDTDAEPESPDSALDADELHELWPALSKLTGQLYETGRVTDTDRLIFRTDVERAAVLAQRLLPAHEAEYPRGYQVLTSVLTKTSLDEIIGLSLEQFRHLQESLDEAQELIKRRLPEAEREPSTAAGELDAAAPVPAERRRGQGFPILSGFVAVVVLAVAVVVAIPSLRKRILGHPTLARLLGRGERQEPGGAPKPDTSTTPAVVQPIREKAGTPSAKGPEPKRHTPAAPKVGKAKAPPKSKAPPAKVKEPATPVPKAKTAPKAPARRFFSRWKPGKDGWITLFDGKGLDGWIGANKHWQLKGGELRGLGGEGRTAFLNAREADWQDYTLAVKLLLGNNGTAVISHGILAAHLGNTTVRLGYPQQGWRTLDEKDKGLGRKKWYDVVFEVKGKHAEVRVNGQLALTTDAHTPLAGAPALEAVGGGVAFRSIRVKLHESDPDYRAVALGEGYAEDPSRRTVVGPPPDVAGKAPRVAALPLGEHRLFNGRDFKGWATQGSWVVRDRQMIARADFGEVATAVFPATAESRDYILTVRCRLLRSSKRTREGEYFFLIFRYQSPDSFYCMRLPIEGIFELGYYHRGRFREAARGVRKGHYNQWHEIELTVRGNDVSMRVDRLGGMPTLTAKYFRRGAIGVGVTGGEVAFRDIRVRILR